MVQEFCITTYGAKVSFTMGFKVDYTRPRPEREVGVEGGMRETQYSRLNRPDKNIKDIHFT